MVKTLICEFKNIGSNPIIYRSLMWLNWLKHLIENQIIVSSSLTINNFINSFTPFKVDWTSFLENMKPAVNNSKERSLT